MCVCAYTNNPYTTTHMPLHYKMEKLTSKRSDTHLIIYLITYQKYACVCLKPTTILVYVHKLKYRTHHHLI